MAKNKREIYNEELKTAFEKHTWSGHFVANHNIVDREEAHDYIALKGIKVIYQKELHDGTPRRIWNLLDSEGIQHGKLYTARGTSGHNNKEKFQEDIFDNFQVQKA